MNQWTRFNLPPDLIAEVGSLQNASVSRWRWTSMSAGYGKGLPSKPVRENKTAVALEVDRLQFLDFLAELLNRMGAKE